MRVWNFIKRNKALFLIVAALVLATSMGFFSAYALGSSGVLAAKTVTINVATGPTGPQGPAGPPGATGPTGEAGLACPNQFSPGELVINHPGGQTSIWTCIKD